MSLKLKPRAMLPTPTALPAPLTCQSLFSATAPTPSATMKALMVSLSSTGCAEFLSRTLHGRVTAPKGSPRSVKRRGEVWSRQDPPSRTRRAEFASKSWVANIGTMSSNTPAIRVLPASKPYPKSPVSPAPHRFRTSAPTVKKSPTP